MGVSQYSPDEDRKLNIQTVNYGNKEFMPQQEEKEICD
jgi:hypothetical protein